MICQKCGSEQKNGAKFCPKCGAKFGDQEPFLLYVQGFNSDHNIPYGEVQRGTVSAGDEVELVGVLPITMKRVKKVLKSESGIGIEVDKGSSGDVIGLELSDAESSDFELSQAICQPGSMSAFSEFEAVVIGEIGFLGLKQYPPDFAKIALHNNTSGGIYGKAFADKSSQVNDLHEDNLDQLVQTGSSITLGTYDVSAITIKNLRNAVTTLIDRCSDPISLIRCKLFVPVVIEKDQWFTITVNSVRPTDQQINVHQGLGCILKIIQ